MQGEDDEFMGKVGTCVLDISYSMRMQRGLTPYTSGHRQKLGWLALLAWPAWLAGLIGLLGLLGAWLGGFFLACLAFLAMFGLLCLAWLSWLTCLLGLLEVLGLFSLLVVLVFRVLFYRARKKIRIHARRLRTLNIEKNSSRDTCCKAQLGRNNCYKSATMKHTQIHTHARKHRETC